MGSYQKNHQIMINDDIYFIYLLLVIILIFIDWLYLFNYYLTII